MNNQNMEQPKPGQQGTQKQTDKQVPGQGKTGQGQNIGGSQQGTNR